MTTDLAETYIQNHPYVLVSLTETGVGGTLKAHSLDEAEQLRRGMQAGIRAIRKGIRAEKRRLRLERTANRRDQQRTGGPVPSSELIPRKEVAA